MTRTTLAALATFLWMAGPTAAQSVTLPDVQGALDRLKHEPTVRDVQEAALQYFRVNQDQVDSMRTRARMKALAPVLEVSGGYTSSALDDVSTNSLYSFQDDEFIRPWIIRGSAGTGWNIRGKMTLNLPRLIFNPEELDVASLAGLVEGILKESTRLYYMRRRLQVDMVLKPPSDQATLLSKQLRIEELTAMLDAMTGGWYQKALDITSGRAPREEARRTRDEPASNTASSITLPPLPAGKVEMPTFTPAAVGR